MSNRLFFVSNGKTTEVNERPYEQESDLQKLVADNPNLISKAWSDSETRLFLIQREFGISEGESGTDYYSLDALMVGEDAVPVLVEVKRSVDTRIKREVIAQMLDYACHAYAWDIGKLREQFEASNLEEDVAAISTDEFWDDVAKNLKAERMRLVFVADKIPESLRLLIEFIDRNMGGVDIYGVEVRQYTADGVSLLSANIVGNSLQKATTASSGTKKLWNDAETEKYLSERGLGALLPIVWELRNYAQSLGLDCSFSRDMKTVTPCLGIKKGKAYIGWLAYWQKKAIGHSYNIELRVFDLAQIPNNREWNEQSVRELFSSMPVPAEAQDKGWLWQTPRCVYIDVRSFLNDENFAYFKKALKVFCDSLIDVPDDST